MSLRRLSCCLIPISATQVSISSNKCGSIDWRCLVGRASTDRRDRQGKAYDPGEGADQILDLSYWTATTGYVRYCADLLLYAGGE
jgi:hypothetical protein